MSLFDQLGNGTNVNMEQVLSQLRNKGMNIPAGMNNPQQILNHLMQTNQLNNPRLQMLNQMAVRLFGKGF